MGPLQLLFGLINFIICLGGIGLVGVSSWLLVNPESFFELLEKTNDQINGNSTVLPDELLEFFDQISSGLWLTLVGGTLIHLNMERFNKFSYYSFIDWFPWLLWCGA